MKKLRMLAPVFLFLAGAAIFFYPSVANGIALRKQSREIHTYEAAVDKTSEEELKRFREEAVIYNDNLAGDPLHDPFVLGSGFVMPDNYKEVLNPSGDGIMCYIEIPRLQIYLPVYHGTEEEVLQKGVGHVEGSALPVGGEYRNPVLCAHRGLPTAELFTRLDEMKEGDLFYIHVLGETLAYETARIDVVLPEEVGEYLSPEKGEDSVTLMTCTPYSLNTHRLLVRGERTEYEEPVRIEQQELGEKNVRNYTKLLSCLGVGGAGLALIVLTFLSLKGKKKSGK